MSLWIPFLDNVNSLFIKRFCFTQITAGKFIAITYLTAAMTSIPVGLFVDKFGNRRMLAVVGLAIFVIAQLIMLAYPQCPLNGEPEFGAISGLVL